MGAGRGMGGGRGSEMGGDSTPDIHALVRWESAVPVSAALKKGPPAEAAQFYIVSVSGLPFRQPNSGDPNPHSDDSDNGDRREQMEQRMKQSTSLERKGKDPIFPDRAELTQDVDGSTWRFSFPRTGNPITPEDKEIMFVSRIGRASLKAKFPLKEMTYKNQLAL